jgi:hypothetical protein
MQSPEPDDLAQLRADHALLKLRKENAELLADARALETPASPVPPWWKNSATVVTLTAIVAAVVPLTAAVQGWMQTNRELALEEVKSKTARALELQRQTNAAATERERQAEAIRSSYLERLKAPAEHLRALRFVLATTEDKPLRAWAMEEKKIVEDELQKQADEARQAQEAAPKVHKALEPVTRPPVTASQPVAQNDQADAPRVVTSKLNELKEQAVPGQVAAPKVRKTAEESTEQAREADDPLRKPKEWQRHYPGF